MCPDFFFAVDFFSAAASNRYSFGTITLTMLLYFIRSEMSREYVRSSFSFRESKKAKKISLENPKLGSSRTNCISHR